MGNSVCNESKNAIAILVSENINGYVRFHQCSPSSPVTIKFLIKGTSNQTHAIHIHEFGDLRNGCDSLGTHFNPTGETHGSIMYNMPRHAGDLINNIVFGVDGIFHYDNNDNSISLYHGPRCILGRSIVIHEKPDDLGLGTGGSKEESLKTGNAGKRICCAVIGLAKKEHF
jgi:Cu-Zn family superoxide dismutase